MNKSGIYPCGDRVLVKPDVIEETTQGGIVIPETVLSHHMDAQTSGTLISVGPDSWKHYTEYSNEGTTVRGFSTPFAKVGDKVMFAKYGGQKVWGKDGVEYRVLNDIDITALIEEGVTFTEFDGRKKGGVSKK
jgi:chaperonin GroES